jgi:hypothetical protein
MRTPPLFALVLITLASPAQHRPPDTGTQPPPANTLAPIPTARAADTYAIYSLLIPGAPSDKIANTPTQNWVMADTTINITDMNPAVPPNGELKPPPNNVQAFNEAVHDFYARRYQRFRLQPESFNPPRPFPMASEQQVSQLRHPGSGQSGVIFFSAVYFNANQTAALVYVNNWCSNMCAAGQWVYLEKQNGQWVRRSGIVS